MELKIQSAKKVKGGNQVARKHTGLSIMSHIRTFNLHREDAQFPQLLLVVLSQEAQSLGCLSGDVESDTHAVPWLHTLGFELVSTFIR